MRVTNPRRVAALAGLALVPALTLGAVAQAATAQDDAVQPTTSAAPAWGKTTAESEKRSFPAKEAADKTERIAQRGKISKIEKFKDEEGVVKARFVIYGGRDQVTWVTTPDTIVTENGKPAPLASLEKGDFVTAFGILQPDGNAAVEEVVIGGELPPQ